MPTRRAMTITASKGPSALRLLEDEARAPGPGEIRVRAHACGLNFADVFCSYGLYEAAPKPPFVCGFEVAGVVEAVGEGVTHREVGDRVIQLTRFGGYADRVTAPAFLSMALPDELSFEEGAAFPTVFATAWYALELLGHLEDGMRVLVHAAAGGVGTAALQLCKRKDVEVFATCSTKKLEVARAHGADHVIDYTREDFAAEVRARAPGVDLVLDSVGGEVFDKSWALLNPGGHLVSFGAAVFTPGQSKLNPLSWLKIGLTYLKRPRVDVLKMVGDNRTLSGFNLVYLTEDEGLAARGLRALEGPLHSGELKPVVGRVFDFEEAADALDFLRSRASTGKVVLRLVEPEA